MCGFFPRWNVISKYAGCTALWKVSSVNQISLPFVCSAFFKKNLFYFIYLFLVALGLCCCTRAFSSCGEWGLLFIAVHGLLTVVVSLVAEHGLQARQLSSCGTRALDRGLSSCGARAQLLRGMWDLPGPGLKPVSLALAGRLLTTAPPEKSVCSAF